MGSYGIGIGRTLATIVESHHDQRGILWPDAVAPYQVQLISLEGGEERAQQLYRQLQQSRVEVLWDERDVSAGVKFSDADLIGCPVRLVVSKKAGDKIEYKKRSEAEAQLLAEDELMHRLQIATKTQKTQK
jgi:prolyl-tRNA synthetase